MRRCWIWRRWRWWRSRLAAATLALKANATVMGGWWWLPAGVACRCCRAGRNRLPLRLVSLSVLRAYMHALADPTDSALTNGCRPTRWALQVVCSYAVQHPHSFLHVTNVVQRRVSPGWPSIAPTVPVASRPPTATQCRMLSLQDDYHLQLVVAPPYITTSCK